MSKSTMTKSLLDVNVSKEVIYYRLELLKYLDTTFYEEQEFLFFNMLEYTRFIKEQKSVAYTTRDGLIFLNAPTPNLGDELWKWNYVFAHECLHQIYDTFGVGELIISELGKEKYDHYLLNIASDCIINDTLTRSYRKKTPEDLITPKYLKTKYGVIFNRNEDTQFTLYLRLFDMVQKDKDLMNELMKDLILSKNVSIHDENQKDSKESEPNLPQGKPLNTGEKGEGEEPTDEEGESGGDFSNEEFGEYKELLDFYDSPPSTSLKDLINKAKNTLTGPLGDFIESMKKVPTQIKKAKYGISLVVDRGTKNDYNEELFKKTKIILSNKLRSVIKKYKSTYHRMNRRSPLGDGGIIKKGRKIELDKIDLTLSFYVDISGSMTQPKIDKIFTNLYGNDKTVIDTYTKTFKDVLNNVIFDYYAFNENIMPVKNRKIPICNLANVPLDELMRYMKKHTALSLINVIITDAGFDIYNDKLIKEMEDFDGYLIVVTNYVSKWSGYDKIESLSDGRIICIETASF